MLYSVFTCRRDAALLAYTLPAIITVDPSAVIYLILDASEASTDLQLPAAVQPHCRTAVTQFPRAHMYGLPCVLGMMETLQAIMRTTGVDYIVKVDSDTLLRRVDWLQGSEDLIICETAAPFGIAGNATRWSRWGVAAVLSTIKRWMAEGSIREGYPYPEDLTAYHAIREARLPVKVHKFPTGITTGVLDADLTRWPYPAALTSAAVIHCGEPLPDGTRAAPEHVLLRMSMLADLLPQPSSARSVQF